MSRRRAPQKRKKEARKPDRSRLLPLQFENHRIELRSSKEGQNDRADAGEKLDPQLVRAQYGRSDRGADNQLGDRSDNDLRQSSGNAEPDREQARDQRETQPQRRKRPNSGHLQISCSSLPPLGASDTGLNQRHGGHGWRSELERKTYSATAVRMPRTSRVATMLLRGFEYIRKHRRDGDCDENGNREAVICQQRSQTTLLIRPRATCLRGLLGRAGKFTAWCRGSWASSYRRQASGRSHQPHRRLRGTPSPVIAQL